MKKFYIKKRNNPQTGIYYVCEGKLTKAEAKKHENPLYGYNVMIPYDNEKEYTEAIEHLKSIGERIR